MAAATTSPESTSSEPVPPEPARHEPAPSEPGEQRLILRDVSYKDYVLLSDVLGHRPGLHLTFLNQTLEIMRTSPLHEHLKVLIARLVELHALVRGVRILGFGSATYRREDKERGSSRTSATASGPRRTSRTWRSRS